MRDTGKNVSNIFVNTFIKGNKHAVSYSFSLKEVDFCLVMFDLRRNDSFLVWCLNGR